MANTLAIMMALPFAILATLAAWIAIDYDIASTWPIAAAFIAVCALFGGFFLFPVRRILKKKLMYVVVLNPISLVIVLYLVVIVLFVVNG